MLSELPWNLRKPSESTERRQMEDDVPKESTL